MEMVLVVILVASLIGICLATLYACKFLSNKLNTIKEQAADNGHTAILSNMFVLAINTVETVAKVTVGKLEQLMGKDLRENVKAGNISKNELFELAEEAYTEITQTVSGDVIRTLQTTIGDTELYIRNMIEEQLIKLKAEIYN